MTPPRDTTRRDLTLAVIYALAAAGWMTTLYVNVDPPLIILIPFNLVLITLGALSITTTLINHRRRKQQR